MSQTVPAVLALVGPDAATLKTTYTRGTPISCGGLAWLEWAVLSHFTAATASTSHEYQVQVSEDGVRWDPAVSERGSDGSVLPEHSLANPGAGASDVKDRIMCPNVKGATYAALACKATVASDKATDTAGADAKVVGAVDRVQ